MRKIIEDKSSFNIKRSIGSSQFHFNNVINYLHLINSINDYIPLSFKNKIKNYYNDTYKFYKKINRINNTKKSNKWLIVKFMYLYFSVEKQVERNNAKILKKNKVTLKDFFKDIEGKALDNQQIEAVLSNEDSSLIVAGAGSGKTLTIIGKVKYLIEIRKIKPDKILLLSFTNKTVDELNERLLNLGLLTKAKTFHKLGFEIVKQSGNDSVALAKPETLNDVVRKYLSVDILEDNEALKLLIEFISCFMHISTHKSKNDKFKTVEYILVSRGDRADDMLADSVIEMRNKNLLFLNNDIIKNKSIYIKLIKLNSHYLQNISKLLVSYVVLLKENSRSAKYDQSDCSSKGDIKEDYNLQRASLFNDIASSVYKKYKKHLNQNSQIDFSDMINEAILRVKNKDYEKRYDYIIVDEYQDISANRFELIKVLRNNSNAKIVCVGDDWQSIYRFAGSDITLFNNFEAHLGDANRYFIEKTYRNSQQLVNISAKFIQKNKSQIKKSPRSFKSLSQPLKHLMYEYEAKARALECAVKYFIKKYGIEKDILVLGRHAFDINQLLKLDGACDIFTYNAKEGIIVYKKYNKIIKYLTVHKAKGLESDNVIILNCDDSLYGFPNKVRSDPVLSSLLGIPDEFPFAEERRLFYVALTRTKNEVCLLLPKNMSVFSKEIMKYSEVLNTSDLHV